jgi:Tripartite tricarboxylate transporter TctB family
MPQSPRDVLAGLVFVAFGLAFAIGAATYEVGTPDRMGPGYFPLVLGGALGVLGGIILARGLRDGEEGAIGAVAWRAAALIVGSVLFFGLTVRGLGLVPTVFVSAVMSAFASRRSGPLTAVLIGVALTVICVLVFVVALRLRIPLIGPWIPV